MLDIRLIQRLNRVLLVLNLRYINPVHMIEKLSKMDLILPATLAEEYVSGGFFADNVAPALLGGATLTRSSIPLDVTHLGSISDLVIIFP